MKNFLKECIFILLTLLPTQPLLSQWVQTNSPYSSSVNSLAVSITANDATLFAGTTNGVFRSTDAGTNWDIVNNGLTDTLVAAIVIKNSNLFAGTSNGVFRSSNNGESWDSLNTGLLNKNVRALLFKDTKFFAGTMDGIFLSTDNGTIWSPVINQTNTSLIDIQALVSMDTNLFASRGITLDNPSILLSTDNGISWSGIYPGEGGRTGQYYSSLTVLDTIIIAGSVNSNSYGIVLLHYNGEQWTISSTGLDQTNVYSIAVFTKGIFAGTDNGVYYSSDNGVSWTDAGLTEQSVSTLIIFDNYIFAGTTTGGIWKRPLSEIITSVDQCINNLPDHFKLEQNYPNPFNPTTQIKYSITESSFISLKVYNMLGEEIAILFEGFRQPGNYKAIFNGQGFTSGIYFYRLKSNNFEQTKKLLLLK